METYRAHNPEAVGSNPALATKDTNSWGRYSRCCRFDSDELVSF